MKQAVIVLLSLGLVGALASTIQVSDNKNKPLPDSDSVSKHKVEDTLNKEQKDPVVSFVDTGLSNEREVSITIEEFVSNPDDLPAVQDPDYIADVPEFPLEDNDLYKSLNGYDDEIMDVAASWVAPPFFRRQKQKARRRFSAPRHFIPNPYRRFHYYPYYAFYRPRPYFY